MDSYKNDTERRFAAYLDERGLPFEYEPELPASNRHPDFLVHTHVGDVVCEATELAYKELPRVASIDPYKYVRNAIDEKIDQGAGAKALGLPYVIVMGREGPGPGPLDSVNVTGAMYGDHAITFRIDRDTGGSIEKPRTVFGQGGRLQKINTRVSAIALIRSFNPTRRVYEERVSEQLGADKLEFADALHIASAIGRAMVASGEFAPDAEVRRVLVFHNVYARVPLPRETLAGPYDEVHDEFEGSYGVVSRGIHILAVPGVE